MIVLVSCDHEMILAGSVGHVMNHVISEDVQYIHAGSVMTKIQCGNQLSREKRKDPALASRAFCPFNQARLDVAATLRAVTLHVGTTHCARGPPRA